MKIFDHMMHFVNVSTDEDMFLQDTNIIMMIEDEYPLLYDVVDEDDLAHALECYVNFGEKISPETISPNFMIQCTKHYPEILI